MGISDQDRHENARMAFVRAVEQKRVALDGRQILLWSTTEMPNPLGVQDHYTVEELWNESARLRRDSHHVGYPPGIYGH